MLPFKIIYWLGMVGEIIIRAPYQKNVKADKTDQRVTRAENLILSLIAVGMGLLPLIYTFTHWLGFADYHLPAWLGWLGATIYAAALYVFYRAHTDLKSNWSPSVEIYQGHALITNGIYRTIRHPMYASQLLMGISQALLLQNWLAGPISLIVFIPFYLLRVRAEEKMMLDTFGEEYRQYLEKTGGILPKL